MKKVVTLKEIEAVGVELNHLVGITAQEHEKLLNETYTIAIDGAGIVGIWFADSNKGWVAACPRASAGGWLNRSDPNTPRIRSLFTRKS